MSYELLQQIGTIWYNVRKHNEPSGCEASYEQRAEGVMNAKQTFGECVRTMMKRSGIMVTQ